MTYSEPERRLTMSAAHSRFRSLMESMSNQTLGTIRHFDFIGYIPVAISGVDAEFTKELRDWALEKQQEEMESRFDGLVGIPSGSLSGLYLPTKTQPY